MTEVRQWPNESRLPVRTRAAGLVFALLLAPASASAECAWVLWTHDMTLYRAMLRDRTASNAKLRLTWDRVGTPFETKAECMALLQKRAESLREYRDSGQEAKTLRKWEMEDGKKPGTMRPMEREDGCWPVGANPWPQYLENG